MAEEDWLRAGHTDAGAVGPLYDEWAARYDRDLDAWNYRAPAVVADRLASTRPLAQPSGPVLDVGCGTGLVGRELAARSFKVVDGIDLSPASIEIAETTGAYRSLQQVDLQSGPVPADDDTYAALVCVGVMTYLPDTERALREFCRVVGPGGTILFTQREDFWVDRSCQRIVDTLVGDGTCSDPQVSDALPYLPDSDMGDIGAHVVELTVGTGRVRRT